VQATECKRHNMAPIARRHAASHQNESRQTTAVFPYSFLIRRLTTQKPPRRQIVKHFKSHSALIDSPPPRHHTDWPLLSNLRRATPNESCFRPCNPQDDGSDRPSSMMPGRHRQTGLPCPRRFLGKAHDWLRKWPSRSVAGFH
jgi:hypothetical protein